ncbi:MAG: SPW repeat protein [Candidatus Methylomirabilales bacterium]
MKWISWTNCVLGLWLVLAPFTLDYGGNQTALWEDVIVGLLIAVFAFWRAVGPETKGMAGASWTVAILGLWALIAPFVLGYSGIAAATTNDVIVGVVVAALATYRALEGPHEVPMHGGERHHGAH